MLYLDCEDDYGGCGEKSLDEEGNFVSVVCGFGYGFGVIID